MPRTSWFTGVTRYQWLVLFVAWLGWVFDSMDATLYALVLHPALHELLQTQSGAPVTREAIIQHGGVIFSLFLVGWAAGGVLFGVIADRFGRTRTLMVTILVYAVFTGLASLSGSWQALAFYRFLTALGIGGEWAAGAALVAEVWPEDKRAKVAGILQSAWAAGFLLAALINLYVGPRGWRPVFLVGILPAAVALLVRLWVKEPDRWLKTRAAARGGGQIGRSRIAALFAPELRRSTLVGAGLAFVAVFGLWGATNWSPTFIRSLPDLAGLDEPVITRLVSYATIMLNVGALAGYLTFGPLADRFGRRTAFGFMCVGSLVMLPVTYLGSGSYAGVLLLLPALGFFNNGIFSGFPIYLPELFPTRLRATGAGFCFNIGRVLAAAGPMLSSHLVAALGGIGRAASAMALIYVLGLLILPFAPETRGNSLPE